MFAFCFFFKILDISVHIFHRIISDVADEDQKEKNGDDRKASSSFGRLIDFTVVVQSYRLTVNINGFQNSLNRTVLLLRILLGNSGIATLTLNRDRLGPSRFLQLPFGLWHIIKFDLFLCILIFEWSDLDVNFIYFKVSWRTSIIYIIFHLKYNVNYK